MADLYRMANQGANVRRRINVGRLSLASIEWRKGQTYVADLVMESKKHVL